MSFLQKKTFSLLRYFSVTSFACILLAAIFLGWFYRTVSINQLIQHGEHNNIVLAQTLANTILPHFESYSIATKDLEPSVVRTHLATTRFHKFIIALIIDTPVLKVKFFNLNGLTLFSTEPKQIGVQKPANYKGSISAKTGNIISKLSFRSKFSAVNEIIYDRQVISSYLPMRNPVSKNIDGVFEVYYDVTELFEEIKNKQFYLSVGVIFILSLLYGVLFIVVRHADLVIKDQAEALKISRDEALKANVTKSTFLANMSHELRTPLNAIIGYSELIHDEITIIDSAKDLAPDLIKIRDAGEHLLNLINTILDMSKIEAGKMDCFLEPVDIKLNVLSITSSIEVLVQRNNNKLVVECPDSIGEMKTDLTKLRQILLNISSNAAKFTKNGTIKIQISTKIHDEKEWIVFKISDDGIGMTPAQSAKVFNDFSQADESTTRNFGGTGLGLSITKRLCTLLGGHIYLESERHMGSMFIVELPRIASTNKQQEKISASSIEAKSVLESNLNNANFIPPVNRRKSSSSVLVIDGDDVECDSLEKFLCNKEFTVFIAKSADEGIQLARKYQPNVILLDIMMPAKDGYTALFELKEDKELNHIPVIILPTDKDRSQALSKSDCLNNPVKIENLTNAIIALVRLPS